MVPELPRLITSSSYLLASCSCFQLLTVDCQLHILCAKIPPMRKVVLGLGISLDG